MTTRWIPDTCSCVMEFDEIHGVSGIPIFTFFQSCGVHPNAEAAYNTNKQKNLQINAMVKAMGIEPQELLDKGVSFKLREDGSDFDWDTSTLTEDEKSRADLALEETRAKAKGLN